MSTAVRRPRAGVTATMAGLRVWLRSIPLRIEAIATTAVSVILAKATSLISGRCINTDNLHLVPQDVHVYK